MPTLQVPRVTTNRDDLQDKISEASQILYDVAKSAYGPAAGNVMLGFKHGAPLLSRDGVTNIKMVRHHDPVVDDAIQALKQASEKNNQKVGDGTTAAVILSHHLLVAAQRLEGKGYNPMDIAKKLKQAEKTVVDWIDEIKKPVDSDEFLDQVATVSAGDPELGAMISDVMKEIGKDGGVVIEQYEGLGVHNEIIDGFYFHKGYKDTDLINDPADNQSRFDDVAVLISNQTFNTEVEIAPVINEVVKAGIKELVIIGDVNNAALQTLKLTRAKGLLVATPVDPPYVVGGRSLFLDDIALMTGGEVYNGIAFDPAKHLGQAREVIITEHATTILDGDGDKEAIKERVKTLRKQLEEESHPSSIQFIKDRLARLTNKMATIKVGGAVEFERDEIKLRVQDAVCAVQSAMKDGILPGGGTVLARVEGTEFDDAFRQPFKQLVQNAGLNPEQYIAKLEESKLWEGFNLRNITDKPINMLDEGIIDPSLVVKEIVSNSVAIVAGLITASAAISYEVKEP